jgi:dual specificity tyrosine-phosphorylation-regulated kinase 1
LIPLFKRINAAYCARRRLAAPGPKYNQGYDDKEGHYIVLAGEEILQRYTALEVLGKGSFGTVLKCFDDKRMETVAMKITRQGQTFRTQAKLEIDILLRLNGNPALNYLVVKLLKVFDWQGHLVLVFELLSFNLYQLIKCTRFAGVSLDLTRKFALQLIQVLRQLEAHTPPIIHCDLKPENVLLRNPHRSGIRLIDFGSACYSSKKMFKYIQSRYYRSPEVILGLEYTTAIDRWSLGCVLVELHTGVPLFDGKTEAQQLAKFEEVLGPLPLSMIAGSPKRKKFYEEKVSGDGAVRYVRLGAEDPCTSGRTLASIVGVYSGGPRGSRKDQVGHDVTAYEQFVDFVRSLLVYDPAQRISCTAALDHPFLAPLAATEQPQKVDASSPAQ